MRKKKTQALTLDYKKIDNTKNHLLEEIRHNELINKKHKNTCVTLNYFEHVLVLASTFTGCV